MGFGCSWTGTPVHQRQVFTGHVTLYSSLNFQLPSSDLAFLFSMRINVRQIWKLEDSRWSNGPLLSSWGKLCLRWQSFISGDEAKPCHKFLFNLHTRSNLQDSSFWAWVFIYCTLHIQSTFFIFPQSTFFDFYFGILKVLWAFLKQENQIPSCKCKSFTCHLVDI